MDKSSFFKENFKKGNLVVSICKNRGYFNVYEFLETYKEEYRWLGVQRYYLNGEFSPLFTDLNIMDRLSEDSGTDEYVVIEEFCYD